MQNWLDLELAYPNQANSSSSQTWKNKGKRVLVSVTGREIRHIKTKEKKSISECELRHIKTKEKKSISAWVWQEKSFVT